MVVAFLAMAFVRLAGEVREQETLPFDSSVLMYLNTHSTHFLDGVLPIATDIGGAIGVGALTLLFGGIFIYRREYTRVAILMIAVIGVAALNLILKAVFMRPRPDLWLQLVHETGYSFPSGHAMMSAGFGIALAIILWRSRWRWWGIGFATSYILFVGFSRLYLGVHYPTDIIAGWFVSTAWVLVTVLVVQSRIGQHVFRRFAQTVTTKK